MRTYFSKKEIMKKRYIYILLAVSVLAVLSFTIIRYSRKAETYYQLKDRKGSLAQTQEWVNTSKKATELLNKVKLNPQDNKSLLALSALFIQESRITGDHVYYDMAAMK